MRKLNTKVLFFVLALVLGQSVCFSQQVLTVKQTQILKCAKEKIYAVYNFFNTDKPVEQRAFIPSQCGKSDPIPVPAWLEEALPTMVTENKWQDSTNSGYQSYNMAQMWQMAFEIIQEYLSLADNINEGTPYTSQEIMEQFAMLRTRFLIILDMIASEPVFYESMGGRGRQIISTFELINQEMLSVGESFVVSPKQWRNKFRTQYRHIDFFHFLLLAVL